MKHFYAFAFFLMGTLHLLGQNPIGLQQVVNFSNVEYKGGNQNWDIQQDKSGIMYFANNEGLLSYNGQTWKLNSIPNKTVVRSVKLAADGKIYIGAQDDIGYFYPDALGVLRYTSLKNLIPKQDSSFTDVWHIVIYNKAVYFSTTEKIFELKDNKVTSYASVPGWLYLAKCNESLFAEERTDELMEFKGGSWTFTCKIPQKAIVTAILKYAKDTLLIATLKNGLFLLHDHKLSKMATAMDKLFPMVRINTAQSIGPDLFAIGSAFSGCYIIDHKGRLIQNFSNAQTLQKNNIRSLFADRNKNIWLGLDDGISFIAYNSPIKQIYPDANKQSSTYAVRIFNKNLYIGTSDAVFKLPVGDSTKDLSYCNGTFTEVPNTKGQVWNLNDVNAHLLLGNEDGASEILNNTSKQIYTFPGTWLFKPLSLKKTSADIIAGTYNGLRILKFEHNKFSDMGPLAGSSESLRFITVDYDQDVVWASHPYRGVFKISLSPDHKKILNLTLYTQRSGLPSSLHNYVFKIKGHNVVATQNGIYEYNPTGNNFYLSKTFFPMFKNTEIQYLNEDKQGNIWFIGNKKVGVIDCSRASAMQPFTVVYFTDLTAKVLAGFENIYAYNDQNIFVGSNRGVFHINYQKYQHNRQQLNVLLGQVKIIGERDSTIFGGYFMNKTTIQAFQDKKSSLKLAHNFNSFHFDFSSTLFEQHSNIEFSYQLVGFDKGWSPWSAKSEKEYTNLGHGIYLFKVKSRNNLGNESNTVEYTFEIKPAWYETYWSYCIYFCLLCGLIYSIIKLQRKKHSKEQLQLQYMHQLELDHNEKEIISLKNEKLEVEVGFKNKELATTTMHLVQRGKLMAKIKEGLIIIKESETEKKHEEALKVLKLLTEAERSDDDWDHFAVHFDQVHSDFLNTLKTKFPSLSGTDLKICAYLKMNLSSKEIAQLMSVTTGAVEVSRYRLRKKLNLPSNMNLFDYLVKATAKTL